MKGILLCGCTIIGIISDFEHRSNIHKRDIIYFILDLTFARGFARMYFPREHLFFRLARYPPYFKLYVCKISRRLIKLVKREVCSRNKHTNILSLLLLVRLGWLEYIWIGQNNWKFSKKKKQPVYQSVASSRIL